MQLQPLRTRSPETGAVRIVSTGLLKEACLLPRQAEFNLGEIIALKDFPWAECFERDPEGVAAQVTAMMLDLMHPTPGIACENIDFSSLPQGRAKTHLSAL